MTGEDGITHGRLRRTTPLAGFTARAAGGRLVASLREKTGDTGAVDRFHERTAERYAELLGHSKGVLMKAGQILSMVDASAVGNGSFSPYQKALTRLQADAPPMAPAPAHGVLQADLGRPAGEIFAEFSDTPMAAASIGQVHRAVLRDGREVAVKIQYPGAAQAIRADLANTELIATFLRLGASSTGVMQADPRSAAQELSERIAEELDYRNEAANLTAFNRLYQDHPFIRIPDLVPEASGDQVLTMTYLDGLDWAQAQDAPQELKDVWGEVIFRFAAGSYGHANLFHGDPHPGNYRFGRDGTVGFVDFGCVKTFTEVQRRRIVRILRAVLDDARDDLRAVMVEAGFFDTGSPISADDVFGWWAPMLAEAIGPQPATYSVNTSSRQANGLLDFRNPVLRQMKIPPEYTLLSRLQLSVNSIVSRLATTFHARAMIDDIHGRAEPASGLGMAHRAWVIQRGLPFALDDHEEHREKARIGSS
ncbi:MAG: ABC1 kinase family protein [Mycobacterium sp.]